MLTSISPVGEHGRGQRWWLTVTAYVLGSVAGGALTGAALGSVGAVTLDRLPVAVSALLLAAVAVAGLLLDAGVGGLELPTWHRQVDEQWLTRYRGWVYGVGFGFQLGVGLVTIVTSSVVYVVWAAALLSASPSAGCGIGALFGLARALPLLAMGGVRTTARLGRLHRRLSLVAPSADRATRVAQAVVVAVTVTAVVLNLGIGASA